MSPVYGASLLARTFTSGRARAMVALYFPGPSSVRSYALLAQCRNVPWSLTPALGRIPLRITVLRLISHHLSVPSDVFYAVLGRVLTHLHRRRLIRAL